MPAHIREVAVHRTTNLEEYANLDHREAVILAIQELGREVTELLHTRRVFMVNSTETGGGVAEMMPRLVSLLNDVGVDMRWLVLEPDSSAFFDVTKGLHNMIHGAEGFTDVKQAKEVYDAVSREGAASLQRIVDPMDILAIHDPQPCGMLTYLPETYSHAIWRCHIGVTFQNEHTRTAWELLEPHLARYSRTLFSVDRYIPDMVRPKSSVLTPCIDAMSHKNRSLRPYKIAGVLRSAGLVEGPEVDEWARFAATAERYEDGKWVHAPIRDILHGPIVLQVSRFDRLKGFQHLIPAFVRLQETATEKIAHLKIDHDRAKSEIARSLLLLAGPDPSAVADDPEAAEVLDAMCAQHDELPRDIAARVHLLRLPMQDTKQNALIVNALQRLATIVVQNSIQEGFGLTVTEALWKGAPVVASNVGGISVQIRPGTDGVLVDDPADVDGLADALLHLLVDPRKLALMGQAGRKRVMDNFLILQLAKRWLEELRALLTSET